MGAISRIVVGVDGSEGSRAAAAWTASVAATTGAQVTAVHGVGKLPDVFVGAPEAVAAGLDVTNTRHLPWRKHAELTLERWCEPLREGGIAYRAEIVDDFAAHALLAVAEKEHADLIVVGARSHGVVNRMLGGVPYKLAHHAHVPVVIVPASPELASPELASLGELVSPELASPQQASPELASPQQPPGSPAADEGSS